MMEASETTTILICDDIEDRRHGWKQALREVVPQEWEIKLLGEEEHDLDHELAILQARQLAARPVPEGGSGETAGGTDPNEPSRFDRTSILIVDYDLARFQSPGLTGERITYLARCYSECKLIVGVNITGQANYFDLTLVDRLDSFADVNVGSDQLTSPVLWGKPPSGLSPWAWPSLPRLLERHDECVEIVSGDEGAKLLATVGLGGITLPRKITQPIEAAEDDDPDFACFARESSLGLRGDDAPWGGTIARVAASRARKWLQNLVLPAQDILVDAPHLAQRNPLLLGVEPDSLSQEVFDRTIDRDDASGGLIADLESHRLETSPWFDRPVWRWAAVNSDDELPGVASPWDRPEAKFFFCEDVSRFLPAELTRRFVVDDVPTSYSVRYVAKQNDPQVNEIVGAGLGDVKYLPKVRLTL